MKLRLILFTLALTMILSASSLLEITKTEANKFEITLDHETHENYGCKYPITYEFNVDNLDSSFFATKSSSVRQTVENITVRNRNEIFNAVDALRLDIENNRIYLSVGFTEYSDYLKIEFPENYNITFDKISKYYDNRDAIVTCSFDDAQGWKKDISMQTGRVFQQHKVWISMAFITDGIGQNEANQYQEVINDGYIEIAAHSRSHPSAAPYGEKLVSEISGNKQDLVDYFNMPDLFRKSGKEYVYTWIAPNGYRDDVIDSLLAEEYFLLNRLYSGSFNGISEWKNDLKFFAPFGMTGEMGNTSWASTATTDTVELKNRFDNAYATEGVYHFMMHPQSIDWNERYGHQHLEYISGRDDVWYVALGHLYLYELLANVDYQVTSIDFADENLPKSFSLSQNYPNPFNPTTTIQFSIPNQVKVELNIYDIMGRKVNSLVSSNYSAGNYNVVWDGTNDNGMMVSSGIYFYQVKAGNQIAVKKMSFLK